MASLEQLRHQIHGSKCPAAGQPSRHFMPKGLLDQILTHEILRTIICLPEFQIPPHKWDSTSSIVLEHRDGLKVIAILLDLELEHKLTILIENGIFDQLLPQEEHQLQAILGVRARDFVQHQWEYIAHEFSSGMYQRKLRDDVIIPYIHQKAIGGGGFSSVYEVLVHSAHQQLIPNPPQMGVRMIRKEIMVVASGFSPKDESELLFLLGTLKHRNIVELMAAYIHNGRPNLLLRPADLSLEDLLQQQLSHVAFKDDDATFKAVHGLTSALKFLHNFQYPGFEANENYVFIGMHQDIKPRNILVRAGDLLLSDFGLSRLKPIHEGSRTTWKDATFEYGAPECRDPKTFSQGEIGRASDVWSLSCVILEFLVHIITGSDGVNLFRQNRLTTEEYGRTRAFHNGTSLKDEVNEEMERIRHSSKHATRSRLVSLLQECFTTSPGDRPKAGGVETRLAQITIQAAVDNLLEATGVWTGEAGGQNKSTLFGTRFRLERYRLQAWTALLDCSDETPANCITPTTVTESMSVICDVLNNTTVQLREIQPTDAHSHEEVVLSTLCQCNNRLFANLNEVEGASVEARYTICVTSNASLDFLNSISRAGTEHLANNDIGTIAAMKYMSILYSKELRQPTAEPAIDQSLIEPAGDRYTPGLKPEICWLNYGYLPGERKRVIVERRSYRGKWCTEPNSARFRETGEIMFRRVLDLITLLRQPKPIHLRLLSYAGAFHDPKKQQFGIVYDLPDDHSSPVRLHQILKGKDAPKLRPHIGQKLVLAKALVKNIQNLHISGWVHKNISPFNVLFFVPSDNDFNAISYSSPYLTGFEHSRPDEINAYAESLLERGVEDKYRHPAYANRSVPFARHHDYYALGLVLIEIGVWERLSGIYDRHPTYGQSKLRNVYLDVCDRAVLERMGPIYHAATRACLLFDDSESGGEYRVAMNFQRDVVDRLDSCRF